MTTLEPVETPESQVGTVVVYDIHDRLEESFREMQQILRELKDHADPRIRLAAAAEMRHHIALLSRTLKIAMRADALVVFQDQVLEALDQAGVRVHRKVLSIFEARANGEQVSGFSRNAAQHVPRVGRS